MRQNITINVVGKSKEALEKQLIEKICYFFGVDDYKTVEDRLDIEMFIFCGEEEPMNITFTADCRIKVKS